MPFLVPFYPNRLLVPDSVLPSQFVSVFVHCRLLFPTLHSHRYQHRKEPSRPPYSHGMPQDVKLSSQLGHERGFSKEWRETAAPLWLPVLFYSWLQSEGVCCTHSSMHWSPHPWRYFGREGTSPRPDYPSWLRDQVVNGEMYHPKACRVWDFSSTYGTSLAKSCSTKRGSAVVSFHSCQLPQNQSQSDGSGTVFQWPACWMCEVRFDHPDYNSIGHCRGLGEGDKYHNFWIWKQPGGEVCCDWLSVLENFRWHRDVRSVTYSPQSL